jgi:hypothetical protein
MYKTFFICLENVCRGSQISNHSKVKKNTENSWLNGPQTSPKSLGKSELFPTEKCMRMFLHALKMYEEVFTCCQMSSHSKAKKTIENSWLNGPQTIPKNLGKSEFSTNKKCIGMFLHTLKM